MCVCVYDKIIQHTHTHTETDISNGTACMGKCKGYTPIPAQLHTHTHTHTHTPQSRANSWGVERPSDHNMLSNCAEYVCVVTTHLAGIPVGPLTQYHHSIYITQHTHTHTHTHIQLSLHTHSTFSTPTHTKSHLSLKKEATTTHMSKINQIIQSHCSGRTEALYCMYCSKPHVLSGERRSYSIPLSLSHTHTHTLAQNHTSKGAPFYVVCTELLDSSSLPCSALPDHVDKRLFALRSNWPDSTILEPT